MWLLVLEENYKKVSSHCENAGMYSMCMQCIRVFVYIRMYRDIQPEFTVDRP